MCDVDLSAYMYSLKSCLVFSTFAVNMGNIDCIVEIEMTRYRKGRHHREGLGILESISTERDDTRESSRKVRETAWINVRDRTRAELEEMFVEGAGN